MAGGVSLKWHGSQIAVSTGFGAGSPAVQAVTAITKAVNPVVSSTNHGLSDGDVIRLVGVEGMTELDDGVFVVIGVSGGTFQLADVDSRGYGTFTAGSIEYADFSNYCQLTGYNRAGGAAPEQDVTTICSTAAEFELGLPDFGTTTLDYLFNLKDTVQQALQAADKSKEVVAVRVTLPKSNGIMVQLGKVQSTSETAANAGSWTGSTSIRNSGPRVDILL